MAPHALLTNEIRTRLEGQFERIEVATRPLEACARILADSSSRERWVGAVERLRVVVMRGFPTVRQSHLWEGLKLPRWRRRIVRRPEVILAAARVVPGLVSALEAFARRAAVEHWSPRSRPGKLYARCKTALDFVEGRTRQISEGLRTTQNVDETLPERLTRLAVLAPRFDFVAGYLPPEEPYTRWTPIVVRLDESLSLLEGAGDPEPLRRFEGVRITPARRGLLSYWRVEVERKWAPGQGAPKTLSVFNRRGSAELFANRIAIILGLPLNLSAP